MQVGGETGVHGREGEIEEDEEEEEKEAEGTGGLTLDVAAVLPGHAMGADGRRVLAVVVVLGIHLLELVLAIVTGLVLVAVAGRAVLLEAHELPEGAFRLDAARLDVLQDRLLNAVAHGKQLLARGDLGAIGPGLEYLFDVDVALFEVRAEAAGKVRRGGRRLDRGAHGGQRSGVAAARRLRGLGAGLCRLALAAEAGRRHGGGVWGAWWWWRW